MKVHHSNSTQLAQKLTESNTQIQSQLYGEDEYITQRIISEKQLQVSTLCPGIIIHFCMYIYLSPYASIYIRTILL